jgi:hypothetical protein
MTLIAERPRTLLPIGFDIGPKRPAGVDRQTWRKIPLAKRRLIAEGPLDRDHAGIYDSVLILAAELRLHDVAEEDALAVALTMPLDVPPGKERRERRQFAAAVRWAYNPPNGVPLLTGCPRATCHSGAPDRSRMRSRFAAYCDDACAKTCTIRRGSAAPQVVLVDSPFWNVISSSLWADRGLGPEGRAIYELLAALATVSPDPDAPVWASRRYIAGRLNYLVSQTTITRRLAVMRSLGLATLANKRRGLYTVHRLSDEQVEELEAFRGTSEKVAERQRDAERESLEYAEWTFEWDDAEDLIRGTGPERNTPS